MNQPFPIHLIRSAFFLYVLFVVPFSAHSQNPWVDFFNAPSFSELYAPQANVILSDGRVIEDLEGHFEGLRADIGRVKSSKPLHHVEASEGVSYEVRELNTETGMRYLQFTVVGKDGKREVEYLERRDGKKVDRKGIDEARKRWMDLCALHDADKLVAEMYVENALYYNHKPFVVGVEAIAKTYQYMNRQAYSLTLTPIFVEAISRDLALEIGQCSGTYGGKYVLLWRRVENGKWKILFDTNV